MAGPRIRGFKWLQGVSLRSGLAIGFSALIALTLFVGLVSLLAQERSIRAVNRLLDVDGRIAALSASSNAAMLKARRAEKDFLLFRREFGFDEAKSRYATLLRISLAEIRQNMAEVRALNGEAEVIEQTRAIDQTVTQYEAGFMRTIDLYGALGHVTTGLEGQMREKARKIETIVNSAADVRLLADLLALRRHEKDFIARGLDLSVEAFAKGVAHLKVDLAAARLSSERKGELLGLADEYARTFEQYVRTGTGIDEETAAYLAAAHRIEPILEKLQFLARGGEIATRTEAENTARIAGWTISGAVLMALVLGATIALSIARAITRSVDECLDFAKRVARGDLTARLVPAGANEFGALATALNGMTVALQEREAGLHRAQGMAKLSHVITGPDGSFERWSGSLPQLIGVDTAGMPQSTRAWLDILHPDDRAGFRAKAIQAGIKGTRADIEYRLRRADGTWADIRQVAEPLEGHAGAQGRMRWFNTLQDITAQKQAEEALRAAEDRYRDLVEHSRDLICTHDLDGNLLSVNEAGARLSGYPRDVLLRMNLVELLVPAVRSSFPAYLAEIRSRGVANGLMRIQTAGGETRWWEYRNSLRTEGVTAPIVRGTAQDVTERMRAERELRESEQKLRAIFEGALDGILVADAETGMFLTGNTAICRMLGYTLEELVRLRVPDIHPEQDLPRAQEHFDRMLRGEIQMAADIPVMRKDGSVFYADIKAAPIRLGSRGGLLGIFRDITERKTQQRKIERLNRVYVVLSEINSAIVRIRDRTELLREACRIVADAGQLSFVWIGLVDREAMRVVPVAWHGEELGFLDRIRDRLSLRDEPAADQSIIVQAVRAKNAVISNDVRNDPRIRFKKEHEERGFLSAAVFPLLLSGEVEGILMLQSREPGFFDDEETKLLLELAGDIAFAMDHIEKEKRLDYLAYYDSLTRLANRTLFLERLNQHLHAARKTQGKVALALADIERLRTINESLGRQAGDALLKEVAKRLARAADASEIGRISADHFAIVLPLVRGKSEVLRSMEKLSRSCFGEPFRLNGIELRISARMGIALFPSDGDDAETLLRNAEAALRKAKESGERHVFYSPELTERVAERLTLENRLRQALEKEEFVLHYQPKVELETRRIVGAEALIRWQNPELGLVPPGEFIPLMESTGLILEAGLWALSKAVADHSRWLEEGLAAPRVAVNVSAIQLRRRDFVADVEDAIKRGAMPPGIDLEITESLVMEDMESNIPKLKEIRALGVNIAIDDFGTGYSSLGYLARLPVQSLKIDRSFIIAMLNDPDTLTLVRTIISLAQSLRLKVVAEGVDSEEQARFLRLLRCDEMQGYLFSRPLPVDEIAALLKKEGPG